MHNCKPINFLQYLEFEERLIGNWIAYYKTSSNIAAGEKLFTCKMSIYTIYFY